MSFVFQKIFKIFKPSFTDNLDYLNTALLPSDHPSTHIHDNRIPTAPSSLGNHSCTSPKTKVKSNDGDVWKVSACQSCYCRHGVIHCFSQTCPILGCHKTVLKKGHCCPSCHGELEDGLWDGEFDLFVVC